MAANKTQITQLSVADYLAAVEPSNRQADCVALDVMMQAATGQQAKMWGTAIVGYGLRRYAYDSGRKGETPALAFSSRKAAITLYGLEVVPDAELSPLLAKLGKHKVGKGCLYINALAEIDQTALADLLHTLANAAG